MDERDKFPRHVVPSASHEKSGITFSVEEKGNSADAKAEYEVLKSILNRESYLTRLHSVVRTVGKKFKPEVADVLDLVRAASLDVIDSLLKWREVKVSTTISSFMMVGREFTAKYLFC